MCQRLFRYIARRKQYIEKAFGIYVCFLVFPFVFFSICAYLCAYVFVFVDMLSCVCVCPHTSKLRCAVRS